ncbi:MAG TPA: type II toxin-antitoxin system Phd/YefM family antitoxin [Thermosulfidibacter takaii]|uniref:Antitoxin n=1 Tax=Thermosulfidibacter takaii TaxID=412593 RepID=A0A7C0U6Z4_9BACT|nr:type II toxin-antitoxin system Phd/YefM family antitoxin [Thermosulfidibacter takaii]
MIKASVREAKARFSSLLDMVEKGEEVLILRRGRPVAVIKSVGEGAPLTSMRALRESISVKGEPASKAVVGMREDYRY